MQVQIYRNKHNENKYVLVKIYECNHIYVKQFMFWNTPKGMVLNYLASRSNRGTAHRVSRKTLSEIISDYEIIEAFEYGTKKHPIESKDNTLCMYDYADILLK